MRRFPSPPPSSRLVVPTVVVLLTACGDREAPRRSDAPGVADPRSRFEAAEQRLLEAEGVRTDFRVEATGALQADLKGTLAVAGPRARLEARGTFGGRPVDAWLISDGVRMRWSSGDSVAELPTPAEPGAALLVGLTRMGVLHNLARLTGGAPPDHADGGVAEWVRAASVRAPEDGGPEGVAFELVVAGTPSGSATLHLDDRGLPLGRAQVVRFPQGEMRVEERYLDLATGTLSDSLFRISPPDGGSGEGGRGEIP